jgi:hypothetical protein
VVTSVYAHAFEGAKSAVWPLLHTGPLPLCTHVTGDITYMCIGRRWIRLGRYGALVLVAGGTVSNDRDVMVVHMLNELVKRNEQLTPAFTCGRLGNAAARSQRCQSRK